VTSQQQIQIASISLPNYLKRTPWDERALGMETFEVTDSSDAALRSIAKTKHPGHYTVKVDSLASKQALHTYGFYYCDTLIEPFCRQGCLVEFRNAEVSLSRDIDLSQIRAICDGAFVHGRFHRDFNIDRRLADRRYSLWLEDLHQTNSVFGLKYHDELVGFWAFSSDRILLHALAEAYRGKGLSKYFWSLACQALFDQGASEISSSISVSNSAAINLYISLGFKFRNQRDIYHLLIE
jgi:RimJ/RimL family protein N-acetyltransferase